MTRSRSVTQAAAASTRHRDGAGAVPALTSMRFVVFEDNGGAYHWAIVAASGERLVESASFASYDEARQAAGVVRRGAGSASFENLADDRAAPELAARPATATLRDGLDAGRWLDESGSFSSEVVTRWPARR